MHATIALCTMIVGGIVYPEPDITVVPLKEDRSRPMQIQELEWLERVKHMPLPRVPTADVRQPSEPGGGRVSSGRYSPTSPNAPQSRQQVMPQDPTSAGGGMQQNQRPASVGMPGGAYQPSAPRNDPYANIQTARSAVTGGAGGYGGNYSAPVASSIPRASDYSRANSMSNILSQNGLSGSPLPTMSAGGASKPFNDYQAPSGYSPWSLLNERTNNGTIDPYTAYVKPALQQQNFNAHISEQINGVQTQRGYGVNSPGVEVQMGGAGLANPSNFIDYRNIR